MNFSLTPKSFWYSARPRNPFPSHNKFVIPAALMGGVTIAVAASSPPPVPPPGSIAAMFQHSVENAREATTGHDESFPKREDSS